MIYMVASVAKCDFFNLVFSIRGKDGTGCGSMGLVKNRGGYGKIKGN